MHEKLPMSAMYKTIFSATLEVAIARKLLLDRLAVTSVVGALCPERQRDIKYHEGSQAVDNISFKNKDVGLDPHLKCIADTNSSLVVSCFM